MQDNNNITAKASYDKFVRSFTRYANPNKPIKDLATIRSEIQDILKTHRPIRFVDYQFGFSKSLKQRSQIIVHELNEHSKVREYFKVGTNAWKCCEYFSFVQKVQKLYKDKNIDEAVALQKSVLGSEDLNIVCKQKTTVAEERGICRTTDSETSLLLNPKSGKNVQEIELSNMDQSMDEFQEILLPEVSFAKIIENLKDYTNEKSEDILSNKFKLLCALKTHRPVRTCDYQYGVTENLRNNRRVIVFEWNDKKRIREYSQKSGRNNLWVCRECFRLNHRRNNFSYAYVYVLNGIVFIPNDHSCKPRDYELVMIYQKFLEEGNRKKARAMARYISFTYGESSLANIKNFLGDAWHEKSDKRKEIIDDNENNPVLAAPTSIFVFEKPSTLMLNEICAKLHIEYCSRAEKMWEQIMFDKIDTETLPKQILIHHLKTQNFYQILSKFFIGKTKQHKQIKAALIDAFRDKLISSGEASSKKFDKLYLDTVTDEHLSFIAKYLSCRILIFEGAE
uniref:Uncharacterized protein n=1 Tax=Panagrolaimus sp. ES5 TaxID=591445 RepID=A0AC34FUD7_9BILA